MIFNNKRVPPFAIQSFVTAGLSLNMAGLGLISGFTTGLLQQLRRPDSEIPIDDSAASWIASIPGVTIVLGSLFMPAIMSKLGRRTANLCSLAVAAIGWLGILLSNSATVLITMRFFQGIGIGMTTILSPALVGEYTSPKNRGLFLMTLSVSISIAIFAIQTMGEYLHWKTCSIILIGIVLCNIIIVVFSPESPTFLAEEERYDECRKVFRYLRGDTEDEELENMIATQMMTKKEKTENQGRLKDKILAKLVYLKMTIKKKEFYKPILIMLHLYIMAQWSGVNIMASFAGDMFGIILGPDSGLNISLMIVLMGLHRIIGNAMGLILIKKFKRRMLFFTTIGLNTAALLAIAAYTFSKEHNLLPFDHPAIGILLVHIHMFSIATGAVPLTFVLAGELYPMEYKALCGGISMIFYSMSFFSNVKTVISCLNVLGMHGTYLLYAGLLVYCMVVIGMLLPETKDKMLQEIEEEFRGKKLPYNPAK